MCERHDERRAHLHPMGRQTHAQRAIRVRSEGDSSSWRAWPARAGILLIGAYKVILSPVFYALGVRCRHEPTCSSYAVDAIQAQGLWRGSWLALGRVARCRPGGSWGVDPAPLEPSCVPWWRVWSFRSSPGGNEGKT